MTTAGSFLLQSQRRIPNVAVLTSGVVEVIAGVVEGAQGLLHGRDEAAVAGAVAAGLEEESPAEPEPPEVARLVLDARDVVVRDELARRAVVAVGRLRDVVVQLVRPRLGQLVVVPDARPLGAVRAHPARPDPGERLSQPRRVLERPPVHRYPQLDLRRRDPLPYVELQRRVRVGVRDDVAREHVRGCVRGGAAREHVRLVRGHRAGRPRVVVR